MEAHYTAIELADRIVLSNILYLVLKCVWYAISFCNVQPDLQDLDILYQQGHSLYPNTQPTYASLSSSNRSCIHVCTQSSLPSVISLKQKGV